jgi:ABC-type glycerol-3-phosphate transport system substrate-binding protein
MMLGCWNAGMLECWDAGMLGCWNAGPGEISFVQTANAPGIAAGVAAIGGAAGYIGLGVDGLGWHLFTLNRRDPEAVELFCRWLPRLREYVHTSPN